MSHGHTLPDIRRYTLQQVRAYMGAIERAEAARRLSAALDARMSQADGKAWKKYIAGLRGNG